MERTEDAAVGYFKVLYSNSDTAPLYILPHSQCTYKSLGTEIPYAILKGIPSKAPPPLAATCQHISYLDRASECENGAATDEVVKK
jgi:hypothetical protein